MYEKIVVITRQTRMQELIARFNTKAQARFYLTQSGAGFDDYENEDQAYQKTLERASQLLEMGLKVQFVDRRFVSNFLFSERDIVVAIGQDGLVANVAKYAANQPIIGLNPEPSRFDGVLVPVQLAQLQEAVAAVLTGKADLVPVTLAEVKLNDGQRLLAFNDFFIGSQTHVSARYKLEYKSHVENQSSSGIVISTGAGSTGWLSALFNMASGLSEMVGHPAISPVRFSWSSPDLMFVVREPFQSKHSQASVVSGMLKNGETLQIESRMPSGGTIFSDGIESDFIAFNSGLLATVRKATEAALIYTPRRVSSSGVAAAPVASARSIRANSVA